MNQKQINDRFPFQIRITHEGFTEIYLDQSRFPLKDVRFMQCTWVDEEFKMWFHMKDGRVIGDSMLLRTDNE